MFTGMPDFHQSVEMMKNMWSSAAPRYERNESFWYSNC